MHALLKMEKSEIIEKSIRHTYKILNNVKLHYVWYSMSLAIWNYAMLYPFIVYLIFDHICYIGCLGTIKHQQLYLVNSNIIVRRHSNV
jgi:hypothetical protein